MVLILVPLLAEKVRDFFSKPFTLLCGEDPDSTRVVRIGMLDK